MPDAECMPQDLKDLSRRQAIELSDSRWDSDVWLLIESLERVVGEPTASTKGVLNEKSSERQLSPDDMAVLDPTSSNSVFGGRKVLHYRGHRIEIKSGFSDTVHYDGRKVSSTISSGDKTTHVFTVDEEGEEAQYVIVMVAKSPLQLTWRCEVRRNGRLIFADAQDPKDLPKRPPVVVSKSVDKQVRHDDIAVLDQTSSNSRFGGCKILSYGSHRIEMKSGFFSDTVNYDGREVSSIVGSGDKTTHVFTVSEDGEEAQYAIVMGMKALTWWCEVRRNGKIIFVDH
jgi:hypothetical protein